MTVKKLQIVMSYPVEWSLYNVLRDYVQNFFDSVGPEEFFERFQHHYDEKEKTLRMSSDTGFDIKWLMYIGATTKKDKDKCYAGKFGEGFKIASLVAYRDLGLEVTMESEDWMIKVTETEEIIDKKSVKCLAYNIFDREYSSDSVLILKGLESDGYDQFLKVINDFYYTGNPRFGKEIYKSKYYAVYGINTDFAHEKNGYLYANYQMRKYLDLPIIVCNNVFESEDDDRERNHLGERESLDCILNVLDHLNSEEAFDVLERIKNRWDGRKLSKYGTPVKPIICRLIETVNYNRKIADDFRNKYEHEIISDLSKNMNRNRKMLARSWFKNSDIYENKRVVIHEFSRLGIYDIERMCEINDGFEVLSRPDKIEKEYISILKEAAEKYYSDIFQYNALPFCMIITNDAAAASGLSHAVNVYGNSRNSNGLTIKRNTNRICIKRSVLREGSFGDALSVYLHELLHQYGGDCSLQFHRALIMMNRRTAEKLDELECYNCKWNEAHERYSIEKSRSTN